MAHAQSGAMADIVFISAGRRDIGMGEVPQGIAQGERAVLPIAIGRGEGEVVFPVSPQAFVIGELIARGTATAIRPSSATGLAADVLVGEDIALAKSHIPVTGHGVGMCSLKILVDIAVATLVIVAQAGTVAE